MNSLLRQVQVLTLIVFPLLFLGQYVGVIAEMSSVQHDQKQIIDQDKALAKNGGTSSSQNKFLGMVIGLLVYIGFLFSTIMNYLSECRTGVFENCTYRMLEKAGSLIINVILFGLSLKLA